MTKEEFEKLKINDEVIYRSAEPCDDGKKAFVYRTAYMISPLKFSCEPNDFEVTVVLENGEEKECRPSNLEFVRPEPKFLTLDEVMLMDMRKLDKIYGSNPSSAISEMTGEITFIPVIEMSIKQLSTRGMIFIQM